MKKYVKQLIFCLLLVFTAVSCNTRTANPTGETAAAPAQLPTKPGPASPTPAPTLTATPQPTVTATPIVRDLSLAVSDVNLFPIPNIYSGDLVTFQVMPYVPPGVAPDQVTVGILVNGKEIATGTLTGRNLAGQALALLQWVWDTSGVLGEQQVTIVLDQEDALQVGDENPYNNIISFTVNVRDEGDLSPLEATATWVTAETACCNVHAVSGTAAYRDLPNLVATTELAMQQASQALVVNPSRKYDIYFIDRVIGQGGYAASSMVVSYLDRQYAGQGLYEVLVHELVHLLDRQFAPQRITFLAEGLAVWATGGHYKPEKLPQRAAALVTVDEYIPLAQLIDNFYPVQHEIGYLQAASFVEYLIQRNGWEQFKAFYKDVTADDAPTLSEVVDLNLQIYYGLTLAMMEAEWLAYLQELPPDETAVQDLETTIRFYNIMRRYQLTYDPTAHYLTAWLPYPDQVRDQGNPADLTRHPQEEINVTLETMLQTANSALRDGDYHQANVLLDSIERVLDQNGRFIDPLATSYRDIVRKLIRTGFEPQQISLEGNQAVVYATPANKTAMQRIQLVLREQEWIILAN